VVVACGSIQKNKDEEIADQIDDLPSFFC